MNLLTIKDINKKTVNDIFRIADKLNDKKHLILQNKTFVLFFPQSSIRTRLTFEKGIKDLGGNVILFPPETLDKKEKLSDVIKYIENWADCIIVRHSNFEKIYELSKGSNIPIINAMSSLNHPCEILSDIYSIRKINSNYLNLNYTFVGENGNIGNSWLNLSNILNLKFTHVSNDENRIKENDSNYIFNPNLDEVLLESEIVLTDPLSDKSRNEKYYKNYQINLKRMNLCKQGAILNPCPPFFRGEEVSEDVIDSNYFVGHEFKRNLIYVHQAIIIKCLGITI